MYLSIFDFFFQTDHLLLIGIFVIIIFLYYPTTIINSEFKNRIIAASVFWWIVLVFSYNPNGFNYNCYRFSSTLTINNQPAFNRTVKIEDGDLATSFTHPKRMDYTGLQHLVYTILTLANNSYYRLLNGFGFRMWMVLCLMTLIYLISNANLFYNTNNIDAHKYWAIIIITFNPALIFNWIITWEDKLPFIIIPLLIIYLVEKDRLLVAGFLFGLSIAFNGLLLVFIVPFIFHIYSKHKKAFYKILLMITLGFVLGMIPFFPESLIGWQNRFERQNISKPFWYSIFLLFPANWQSPFIYKIIMIVIITFSYLFFFLNKINLRDMIIISVSVVIVFSIYNVSSRMLPVILLIALLTPSVTKRYWLLLSIYLFTYANFYAYYAVHKPKEFGVIEVFIFHIPFLFVLIYYFFARKREVSESSANEFKDNIQLSS